MSNEKLQEVYQRTVIETALIVKRLTERTHALEQLVKDWLAHSQGEQRSFEAWEVRQALRERAKALLEQEVK